MAKYDFTSFFSDDFSKGFAGMTNFPFDMKALAETQRKNMQAFSEIGQMAVEQAQSIVQRQTEILSKIVDDNSTIAREIMAEGSPEEKVARQAELAKKAYEKSVTNWREITDMIGQSNRDAADLINKRVSASLNEVKAALEKSSEKSAPAKSTAKKAA